MRKSELFARILDAVAEETDLTILEVLSHRNTTEIVDARYLMVRLLSEEKFYRSEIARRLNISQAAVSRIFTGFDDRCKKSYFLEPNYYRIRTKLEQN